MYTVHRSHAGNCSFDGHPRSSRLEPLERLCSRSPSTTATPAGNRLDPPFELFLLSWIWSNSSSDFTLQNFKLQFSTNQSFSGWTRRDAFEASGDRVERRLFASCVCSRFSFFVPSFRLKVLEEKRNLNTVYKSTSIDSCDSQRFCWLALSNTSHWEDQCD